MRRFVSIAFIITIFTCISGGMAAYAGPGPDTAECITINEAISTALARNPGIAAARASVDASSQRIRQAQSGFYPKIDLSESFMRTDNPMWTFGTKINQGGITTSDFSPDALNSPPALNNYATRLSVNWFLFDGGATWYGTKQAKYAKSAEDARLLKTRQEIIYQVIKAYYGLVIARENKEVVTRAVKTANTHLEIIENRYKNGLTVKSDVLRAKVHIARLVQELAVAESGVRIAQAALNMVMGNKTDMALTPVTLLSEQTMPDTTLDQWLAKIHKYRPELIQTGLEEKTAEAALKKSHAQYLPSLSLNGTYEIDSERFDGSQDNYTIGATVSMNLFSGFRSSAKTEEALQQVRRIKHAKTDIENRIGLEVRQAYYDVISAKKRIAAAKTAVDQATEAMRIVSNRYKTGILPVVSLLDVEDSVLEANNNYNRALYEATVATARLYKASGTIGENRQAWGY